MKLEQDMFALQLVVPCIKRRLNNSFVYRCSQTMFFFIWRRKFFWCVIRAAHLIANDFLLPLARVYKPLQALFLPFPVHLLFCAKF